MYTVCVWFVFPDHLPDLTAFQQSPSLPTPSSRLRLCQAARKAGLAGLAGRFMLEPNTNKSFALAQQFI